MDVGLLKHELLVWRLLGSLVNFCLIVFITYVGWNWISSISITSISSIIFGWLNISLWLSSITLIVCSTPACLGHALWMSTREPQATSIIKIHWIPTFAAVYLNKILSRLTSVRAALSVAVAAILYLISAIGSISSFNYASGGPGFRAACLYGASLTLVYIVNSILWDRDIIKFPTIQRHRYFRIKQRIPSTLLDSFYLTFYSILLAIVISFFFLNNNTIPYTYTLILKPATLISITLTAFCWIMAAAVLEVVFTERLRPDDYSSKDVVTAMSVALSGIKHGEIFADLALHDVSLLASDVGKLAWRRGEVFRDETGGKWKAFAGPCVEEIRSLTVVLAAALPHTSSSGGDRGSGGGGGTKWNALPSAASKSAIVSTRQQITALLAARSHYQRTTLSARALADLSCIAASEDRLGVLQLVDEYGLGVVVSTLLSALLAVQQLSRQLGSTAVKADLGYWRGSGDGQRGSVQADGALNALRDVLGNAVYGVCGVFGDGLIKVVQESGGSGSDVQRLLRKCLAGKL